MTTKELAALHKVLLPHFPGFSRKGRSMFIVPAKHLLRGIHFDPSAFDKKSFSATSFVMPLFIPSQHLTLNFGDRVRNSRGGDRWNIETPNVAIELQKSLTNQVIPFLSSFTSLQSFIEMARCHLNRAIESKAPPNLRGIESIGYGLALAGKSESARDALRELVKQVNLNIPWQLEMGANAEKLITNLERNPDGVKAQFESWENQTVKNLGLAAFL